MTKTIMLVFGTRPEAIKMAPVLRALARRPALFRTITCVTAQHRQMLDQVLDRFGIAADIDLDLMREGQDLSGLTGSVLVAMRGVLADLKPDLVLVHGDTTTTMAAALAAFYAGIPVGHVEAGLRSGSLHAPFPEELNRRIVDMIASHHFAPTETSKSNLVAEGVHAATVVVTGNTAVDALHQMAGRIDREERLARELGAALDRALEFDWRGGGYVVVTSHRRENIAGGLEWLCAALRALAAQFPAVMFVFPVHRNPIVKDAVTERLAGIANIRLIEPLAYDAFLQLLRHCHCVLTDSGGLQEEAPALGKPVLVMREVTERPEATEAGGVRLVGTDPAAIVNGVRILLTDPAAHARMATAANPYGDGTAGERIASYLARALFSADTSR